MDISHPSIIQTCFLNRSLVALPIGDKRQHNKSNIKNTAAVDPFISPEQGTFAIAYMRNQPCSKEGY
jgi:hypothetical protein